MGRPIVFVRNYLAVRKDDPVTITSTADLARLGDLVTTQRASVFTERLRDAGVRVDDATDDNRVNVRKILRFRKTARDREQTDRRGRR